jgi:hypothetical protein
MIDTVVATVTPSSTFDRAPASVHDRDTDDLDRLAANLQRNRMRESCSSGSVGGEGGNRLTYPAVTCRPGRWTTRDEMTRS